MEKQQHRYAHSNESDVVMAMTQEEIRHMGNHGRQHLHDLTRLRIERNRAARHARCAIMRK